jgi:hypothetical protein
VRCSSDDMRLGLNETKGYPALLILAVDARMDSPQPLGRQGRHAKPAAVTHRSRLLLAFQSTKHDEVFTYGIGVMQGTRLAHLGLMTGDGGG